MELPFNIDKQFITYPFNCVYLGILEAAGYNIDNIILREYMHLVSYITSRGNFRITVRGSGRIKNNRFDVEYIKSKLSIEFIKEALKNGYYLFLFLNEKHISNHSINQKKDYYHDWLIYGFNDNTNMFKCAGYVGENVMYRIFKTVEIPYSDVVCAANNVPIEHKIKSQSENHLFLINYSPNNDYIDDDRIIEELRVVFGLKKKKLKRTIKEHYNEKALNRFRLYILLSYIIHKKSISLTNVRMIYEHMQALRIALQRISNNYELINRYDLLIKKQYKLVLISMKYNITRDKRILIRLYKESLYIKKNEKEVFKKIL